MIGEHLNWQECTALALPAALAERIRDIYGDADGERVAAHLCAPGRVGFRVNGLNRPPHPLPFANEPIEGIADAYWVTAAARAVVTHSDAAATGQIYVQNPSSMLAVLALDPQPGEEILDLAAAPGGKAAHIAACMRNEGRLAVVESVRPRFFRLRATLQRAGVTMAHAYLADGRDVGAKTPERFDRVLLDAPCSSEARVRADDPTSYSHWSPHKVKACASKQRRLLASAFAALKPAGRLVYSTCSMSIEENEAVIASLLANEPTARVLDWRPPAGEWRAGRAVDSRAVSKSAPVLDARVDARVAGATRVLPDDLFDAFFICVLTKTNA